MRHEVQKTESEPRRPRLRFSLLTLLLLTTIVAMGIVIWNQASEVVPMRQELRQLREENGVLTIENPTKVHAIALREFQPRTWAYRVYLPPGRRYFVAGQINDLPLGGELPKFVRPPGVSTISAGKGFRTAIGLSPGEYVITLAVFKDDQGDWRYSLNGRSSAFSADSGGADATGGRTFSVDDQWPAHEEGFATGGVSRKMTIVAPDKPFILLDGRAMTDDVRSSSESTEGAVMWIEPVP